MAMRVAPGLAAVLFVVVCGLRSSHAADTSREEAKRHFERAVALADEKEFDQASLEFETAYNLDATVDALFGWAQSERLAGRCPRAIDLYQRFLAQPLSPVQAQAGEIGLRRCQEAIAEARIGAAAPAVAVPTTVTLSSTAPPARSRGPAVGAALLLAAGTVALGGGAVLFLVSGARADSAVNGEDYGRYFDGLGRARLERTLGLGLAGAGAAALATGAVLWFGRRGATLAVASVRNGGPTLLLRGRF